MVEVKLHDIGEGMTEADINCFLVREGDLVKADDPLVEVQTDKMTAEIPAPRAGVIKQILLNAGETVKVGTTLLIMEEEGGDEDRGQKDPAVATGASVHVEELNLKNLSAVWETSNDGQKRSHRVLASPFTRKIARENNVNLIEIKGSGPAGRIIDQDIWSFIKNRDSKSGTIGVFSESPMNGRLDQEPPNRSERGSESGLAANSNGNQALNDSEGPSEIVQSNEQTLAGKAVGSIPFRGRRKQIARKMVQSLYTIPHCTHFEEIDVSELLRFREELKEAGESVSATAFFIKALSICLKEFPVFNAQLDEENECIRPISEHHIGIAVDAPDGLIVPVVKNVQEKNLRKIHQDMKELTQLALDDKLTVKDISGGTFTISNVGPLGGSIGATPIIQHPQTALVSFHKTKKRPVVTEQDEIVVRSIMNISMAFDHRVADGARAVAFTNRFAQLIENPKMMLLELI